MRWGGVPPNPCECLRTTFFIYISCEIKSNAPSECLKMSTSCNGLQGLANGKKGKWPEEGTGSLPSVGKDDPTRDTFLYDSSGTTVTLKPPRSLNL